MGEAFKHSSHNDRPYISLTALEERGNLESIHVSEETLRHTSSIDVTNEFLKGFETLAVTQHDLKMFVRPPIDVSRGSFRNPSEH